MFYYFFQINKQYIRFFENPVPNFDQKSNSLYNAFSFT